MIAFIRGACGAVGMTRMPSARNTSSNSAVNLVRAFVCAGAGRECSGDGAGMMRVAVLREAFELVRLAGGSLSRPGRCGQVGVLGTDHRALAQTIRRMPGQYYGRIPDRTLAKVTCAAPVLALLLAVRLKADGAGVKGDVGVHPSRRTDPSQVCQAPATSVSGHTHRGLFGDLTSQHTASVVDLVDAHREYNFALAYRHRQ